MRGLLTEALITFILVFVVGLVAGDPRVPSARIASIAVGFALAGGVFIGARSPAAVSTPRERSG